MLDGYDVPMIMIWEYFVKFNCNYDLLFYPFDTQICEMQFQVNGIPKHYLDLGLFSCLSFKNTKITLYL